jgi:GT2 family glycosyltransferase
LTKRVGIVVPTLGQRPDYLRQALDSIKEAGQAHVCLVAPNSFNTKSYLEQGLVDQFVIDPGQGLSEAINRAISALPSEIEYVNWLGDDDLLKAGSIDAAVVSLDSEPETVLVYGACDYIDEEGRVVWRNRSGQWASPLLHFGPDLVPQPGALFRRSAFDVAGGLSRKYDWAFDFDLLLNLKKIGKLKYLKQSLASFRWHPESLSVEHRKKSVSEASRVRISHLPILLKPLAWLWEFPVRLATLVAGTRVTDKARKLAK